MDKFEARRRRFYGIACYHPFIKRKDHIGLYYNKYQNDYDSLVIMKPDIFNNDKILTVCIYYNGLSDEVTFTLSALDNTDTQVNGSLSLFDTVLAEFFYKNRDKIYKIVQNADIILIIESYVSKYFSCHLSRNMV